MKERGRSFIENPSKSAMLGDGIYIRRWHSEKAGVEVGVRNGDREYQALFLTPAVIEKLLDYLYHDGFTYKSEASKADAA